MNMKNDITIDLDKSGTALESTEFQGCKQPARLDDRDFLAAVSNAVLRELEGGLSVSGPPLVAVAKVPIVVTVGALPLPLFE
jgi:hypothetical protein